MVSNVQICESDFNSAYIQLLKRLTVSHKTVDKIKNRKDERLFELVNSGFELKFPEDCFATCRNMSLAYLKGELEFYLSGSDLLKDIACHSSFWNRCTDDGITVNSNYGKLLLHDKNKVGSTQFDYAYECLMNNLESKKAVMVIYAPNNAYISNDNPCTMFLQFIVRDGKLNLYVKMRSSDVWFGLPYDVPFFVLVQSLMVARLRTGGIDISIGVYNHQATSLHLYERNLTQALNVVTSHHDECCMQSALYEEFIYRNIERWIIYKKAGRWINE